MEGLIKRLIELVPHLEIDYNDSEEYGWREGEIGTAELESEGFKVPIGNCTLVVYSFQGTIFYAVRAPRAMTNFSAMFPPFSQKAVVGYFEQIVDQLLAA